MITKTKPKKLTINPVDFIITNKKRLVLVDDEESTITGMKFHLGHEYDLTCFEDGDDAISYIMENPDKVDLIITDDRMKKMCGSEMVSRIKSEEMLKHIPVIMQTGSQSSFVSERHLKAFLQKPVDHETLIRAVKKALE